MTVKEGDIIRKIAIDGALIGPYHVVLSNSHSEKWVNTAVLSNGIARRKQAVWIENYARCKKVTLKVDDKTIKRIRTEKNPIVAHKSTKSWVDAYKKWSEGELDVVAFSSNKAGKRMPSNYVNCSIDMFTLGVSLRERVVRVLVQEVLI